MLSTILAAILGVVFLAAGLTKLTRQHGTVENFKRWGIPDTIMVATGAVETFAAAMLLFGLALPALAVSGALLVIFVMIGALGTHQRAKDKLALWGAPIVLLALAIALLVTLLPES